MKILTDFEIFLNPSHLYDIWDYDYISIDCCIYCSYVKYLYISTINGEINGNCFIMNHIDRDILYYDEFTIYCINCLDNLVLEVKQ